MWYELGNVAYVGSGYAFRGKVESDPNGTLVILQQKDISNLVSMTSEQLAEDVPQGAALAADTDNFDKYRVIKGDVLLQLRGGQFLSVVFKANYPAIAAQGVAVIRPNAGLLPSYLCWFLNHPSTTEKLRSISGGTHIPFISKKALVEFQLPMPPIETQHRVVEADDIRQKHRATSQRLIKLNDELVDAITWQAATQEK